MEMRHYIDVLNRRKFVILLTCFATLVVVAAGTYRMRPVYVTTSLVRVAQPQTGATSYSDINYTERLMRTYVQLLKSRPFLEATIERLALPISAQALASAIKVEAIANTELIRITVESTDARQAARIATTLADLLVEQGQRIYVGEGRSAKEILQGQLAVVEAQLVDDRARLNELTNDKVALDQGPVGSGDVLMAKIKAEEETYGTLLAQYDRARLDEALRANSVGVVEPAVAPVSPSKPNVKLNLVLAAIVGLCAGLGLAFLFENFDPAIHTPDDLANLGGVRLLGRIPGFTRRQKLQSNGSTMVEAFPNSFASESFCVLHANIQTLDHGSFPRKLLVTSAEPRAGKSTIIANLAATMARSGHEVLVVDGDLRDPYLHTAFDLPLSPGFAEAMSDPFGSPATLRATQIPGLRVLTAGSPPTRPADLWQAASLPELVEGLAAEADVVLWDSPPTMVAADVLLLASLVDIVLLVVAEDQSTLKHVELALTQLRQVGAPVAGIVYNRASEPTSNYYHYYTPNGASHSLPAQDAGERWRRPARTSGEPLAAPVVADRPAT